MLLLSFTQVAADPPKTVAYSEARKDVLSLIPKETKFRPSIDAPMHLEVVAQLIELYPKEPLYFMGRDAEYFYDTARFLLRNEPQQLQRIHLINISQENINDPHAQDYLTQEGLTPESIKKNRPVIIDTGFRGKLLDFLKAAKFSSNGELLRGHFVLASANDSYPTSRISETRSLNAFDYGTLIRLEQYEALHRSTHRSKGFELRNGRWEAVSPNPQLTEDVVIEHGLAKEITNQYRFDGGVFEKDGEVSPGKAEFTQQDLVDQLDKLEKEGRFSSRREAWKTLHSLAHDPQLSLSQRTEGLKHFIQSGPAKEYEWRALAVIDLLSFAQKNRLPIGEKPSPQMPDVFDLEIPVQGRDDEPMESIIKKYPHFETVLRERGAGMQRLVATGDWEKILFLYSIYPRYSEELSRAVGESGPSPGSIKFLKALFARGKIVDAFRVLKGHPGWAQHPEFLEQWIEHRSWLYWAVELIQKPEYEAVRPRVAKRLYEIGDGSTHSSLNKGGLSAHKPKVCQFEKHDQ